jgi:REP element-mobilizing transposase RayT
MKPGVFTQLYVQIVFAVEERVCFLRNKEHNEEIFKYISGIVTKLKNKSIIINGVEDHIHIFIGLHQSVSIPDLV